MIHLPELDKFELDPNTTVESLRITFILEPNARMVSYDPISLDGLLARAVVERATKGCLLSNQEDGYWIPLPLAALWHCERGFPLWAASVLYPVSDRADDIDIYHKRNSGGGLHNKKKLKTRAGPWMQRRIPYPIRVCDKYEARCIGNAETIKDLLSDFTHIGKKRRARLLDVIVEPAGSAWTDLLARDGQLIKAVPAASNLIQLDDAPSLVGWTPPAWKPGLLLPGWRVGQCVSTEKSTM